jgi:hypothetical protein
LGLTGMGLTAGRGKVRRADWMVMTVCLFAASGCVNAGDSQQSSCVAPTISVTETSSPPGGIIHVSGAHFVATCNDVVVVGQPPAPNQPFGALPLLWSDRDHTAAQVAVVHPQSNGSFEAVVKLPSTAPPGPGQLFIQDLTAPVNLPITG